MGSVLSAWGFVLRLYCVFMVRFDFILGFTLLEFVLGIETLTGFM